VKTVSTTNGPVTISVPRDRNGEFEPRIVPKRVRRVGAIDEIALSCYSRGMSTRDIEAHLLEVYGVRASRELASNITDVVKDRPHLVPFDIRTGALRPPVSRARRP
jgi:transposase-like protein